MQKTVLLIGIISSVFFFCCGDSSTDPSLPKQDPDNQQSSPPIEALYPVPSKQQLAWQNDEIALFIHFGINTFTGKEWGDGKEKPEHFNPAFVNARQWVIVAKEAGFNYIIFTAKHHDGFCLFPSAFTEYSLKNSPYKGGKGDIVREVADACKNEGVRFGFYLSPWDRNSKLYGTYKYNIYYQNQLIELLTQYGDVAEVWLDGANGEGPNGIQHEYDWNLFYSTIRQYHPNALIALFGPDIGWVGNESGYGEETEWSVKYPSSVFHQRVNGNVWYPSECDVSIRPGWFYHEEEDQLVKSVDSLVDIYFKSVGRNCNLLLNVPPNKDGLLPDMDVSILKGWRDKLNKIFEKDLILNAEITASNYRFNSADYSPSNCLDGNRKTFWVTDKNILNAELLIELPSVQKINIIRLEEAIDFGQRVKSFSVFAYINDSWQELTKQTTIGRSRILKLPEFSSDKVKIVIHESLAPPALRTISAFYYPF